MGSIAKMKVMSATRPEDRRQFDPALLDLLICPVSRGQLTYDRDRQEMISRQAGLAFPIRDGVPVLLKEEARPLDGPEG